jgi:amidohydrolase
MNPYAPLTALAAALAITTDPAVAAGADTPLDTRLIAAISRLQPQVVKWRRDIHEHPELSEQEVRTAKLAADHLRSLGMEVRTGVARTGVIGILRGGKPGGVVALRADMDALPIEEQTGLPFASRVTAMYGDKQSPVMHACGHDAHVAILMGAASALAAIKADIPGTVLFIFQPAEEGTPGNSISGAELMVNENAFAGIKPDAIMGLHVQPGKAGEIIWRPGAMTAASDRIEIQLTGKQTHGAQPWNGIDMSSMAADIVQAFNRIAARQLDVTISPSILSITAINGGDRYNIIPEKMILLGTLRTFNGDIRKKAMADAEASVTAITTQYGGSARFIWTAPTPSIVNDPSLTSAMKPSLIRAADGRIDDAIPYVTGSDDFTYFGSLGPTLFYFLGIGFPPGTNHSPLFDVVDETAMEVGVRAQALTALHFLQISHHR